MRGLALLDIDGLSRNFGGLAAVSSLDMTVDEGEIVGLIGPNGAGKSTVLNLIDGTLRVSKGRVLFRDKDITRQAPHRRARNGIARVFQRNALFKSMTVLDNVMTGRITKMKANFLEQAIFFGRARREEMEHRKKVEEVIDFLEIQHIRKTPVGRLPYGLQKRVELARALAAEPSMLLLDEPMAGMNVEEKQDMCRFILDVNDQFGTTIVLIEHDMGVVMDISDRVVVLDYGKKIGDGVPDEVKNNEDVIKAYLGAGH